MTNVGARLREARVGAGISLQELSARTKIREVLLVAIERSDFERLPKGVLVRGFIRAYAREVDLDPELLVQEFVDEFEPTSSVPVPTPLPAAETGNADQGQLLGRPPSNPVWAVILVICVTLVAYFSDFLAVQNPSVSGGAGTAGSEEGRRAVDIPLESPDLESQTGRDPDVAAAADSLYPLLIEISPVRVVWVQAVVDGKRMLYELIDSDQRRVITAHREVLLRIGDAEAFRYTVNGMRGRPVGGPGEVRDVRITHDNYAGFQDQ